MGNDERLQFESLRRLWANVELVLRNEIRGVFLEPDVDISSRLKNFETIREKLQRSSMRLSQMRDIVGYRIVTPGGRLRQDEISVRLSTQFQDHKIKIFDRRISPTFGYRALHHEVEFDGIDVEIQIRTLLQHEWAEAFERLADICGRGIRYGEPLQIIHLDPSLQDLLRTLFNELVEQSKVIDAYEILEHLQETTLMSHEYDLANEDPFDFVGERRKVLERFNVLKAMLTEIRESLG